MGKIGCIVVVLVIAAIVIVAILLSLGGFAGDSAPASSSMAL